MAVDTDEQLQDPLLANAQVPVVNCQSGLLVLMLDFCVQLLARNGPGTKIPAWNNQVRCPA
jgi:hypothetical protein